MNHIHERGADRRGGLQQIRREYMNRESSFAIAIPLGDISGWNEESETKDRKIVCMGLRSYGRKLERITSKQNTKKYNFPYRMIDT